MGKGDKRSKRGKTFMGSFGKSRPKASKKVVAKPVEENKTNG
jgi:ribosomal small subunit protein bTHX